ncbi:stealth family protein [Providencia rettgeri]|uniref:stealth family protein n=1 Tax=unclassified Providencia TaxID=2633465 RepID=UPI00234926F3|nr:MULTISPECIES: stealth family protein [unclassified Providencia]
MKNEDIDVVIYWVDGNDPEWRKSFELYSGKSLGRFRDLGILKYVFRCIEFNMPWVRHIHFITNGQKPDWLKIDGKLKFHTHEDIFYYKDALPVFNSSAIESNFSNIPGLAEKFILFNDDTLVLKKVKKERFFRNNLPVDHIKLSFPRKGKIYKKLRPQNALPIDFINNSYQFLDNNIIHKIGFNKVLSRRYSLSHNINNLFYSLFYKFFWFKVYHHPQSHLKSTWSNFFQQDDKHGNVVKNTIYSKFRSANDVNQYMYRFINLSNGNFYPQYFNDHISIFVDDIPAFEKSLNSYLEKTFFCICEDETLSNNDFYTLKKILDIKLSILLPNKSTFEV